MTVFTPSHTPAYLDECHRTVLAQTHTDWEWIVLLNAGAEWEPPRPDPRIRIVHGESSGNVGAAKREACALATGEILVELECIGFRACRGVVRTNHPSMKRLAGHFDARLSIKKNRPVGRKRTSASPHCTHAGDKHSVRNPEKDSVPSRPESRRWPAGRPRAATRDRDGQPPVHPTALPR